jgi:hypothetical protein|tara:strand:+ start:1667 stop:1867 length:201 start_codon:yes stop_codon:yes gene_type:complete
VLVLTTMTLCGHWKKIAKYCENWRRDVRRYENWRKVARCYANWKKTGRFGQEDVRSCQRREPKIDC